VYRHEIPGGQLSNLRQQATGIGLEDRFEEVERAYEQANRVLGDIVKVTPTSKVVGDLALFVVSSSIDWAELEERPERFDLPDSVLSYLRGDLGEPPGGLPQPFAQRALRSEQDRGVDAGEPAATSVDDLGQPGQERRSVLSQLLFPVPFRDFKDSQERYGDISVIPSRLLFYGLRTNKVESIDLEPGIRLIVELEAIGEADDRGMRNVLLRLNGQLRTFDIRDESVDAGIAALQRADPDNSSHIAAPLAGVITLNVTENDEVTQGQPIAVLEAMKMESTITAPRSGRVERVATRTGQRLEGGDLILVLASTSA
jgi:pyruvate carboxylase